MQYKVVNNTVKELNANVLPLTFTGNGLQSADLYSSPNSCNTLVSSGSCSPINETFLQTVLIDL